MSKAANKSSSSNPPPLGEEPLSFLQALANEKAASPYTLRNYRQALTEFNLWYYNHFHINPDWIHLSREDFRSYLRWLGSQGLKRAPISLRFSGLRSFYKYLIKNNLIQNSPIQDITLPRQEKRIPRFLTLEQILSLLQAPFTKLELIEKKLQTSNLHLIHLKNLLALKSFKKSMPAGETKLFWKHSMPVDSASVNSANYEFKISPSGANLSVC